MARTIGVLAMEHIAVGLVDDHQLVGATHIFPDKHSEFDCLSEMHAEEIAQGIAREIVSVGGGQEISAVGIGFPGVIQGGIVEDSPNLQQMKGQRLAAAVAELLRAAKIDAPVHALNDADAVAAGIAATLGHLDHFIRVWTLGSGIGYGRYPQAEGIWEGGHTVVSLDAKESFCSCGGMGHLEGVMGHRAMRRRFLDLEPEEVFAHAHAGDERCAQFVAYWHRALAAATATTIHMDGPGKFFITGPSARYVQPSLLDLYLHEMVKMSPLQGSQLEVVATSDETAIIGAALSATHAAANS